MVIYIFSLILKGINMIKLDQVQTVIAGGVDSLSDPPIKLSQGLSSAIVKSSRVYLKKKINYVDRQNLLMIIIKYYLG